MGATQCLVTHKHARMHARRQKHTHRLFQRETSLIKKWFQFYSAFREHETIFYLLFEFQWLDADILRELK